MSNSSSFRSGDVVWLLPYEDVHNHAGIRKIKWDDIGKRNPHKIKDRLVGEFYSLINEPFGWPAKAFTKEDPNVFESIPVEDLI